MDSSSSVQALGQPPTSNNKRSVVLMSGGLDSATAAWEAGEAGHEVIFLFFDYGQRNFLPEEVAFARLFSDWQARFGVDKVICTLRLSLRDVWLFTMSRTMKRGASGGPTVDVKANTVEQRNMVFISVAGAIADQFQCDHVVTGMKKSAYNDSSPQFMLALDLALRYSSGRDLTIWSPLIALTRQEAVRRAQELAVPIHETWSCYEAGPAPCGVCGACVQRAEAGI